MLLQLKTSLIRMIKTPLFEYRLSSSKSATMPLPLRSKKRKSQRGLAKPFVDMKSVRAIGGSGGDGCISLLQAWSNEKAGPDGGDGGSGGHVIFEASYQVNCLNHVHAVIAADNGEKGYNKDCFGKNASHTVVKVPVGTILRNEKLDVVGDLSSEGSMFVAARGGAGGHGNMFFATDTEQTPLIAEYGAKGEDINYTLELRSMAHFGLLGLPNAGKSTLLQAITRAKPKIAPYPFTTLKPHLGVVQYSDYEQITVADLPGLIEDSHKNRGLGIAFLKHIERCTALIVLIDISIPEPWLQVNMLRHELQCFSNNMNTKPQIIVANKIDLPNSEENLKKLRTTYKDDQIVPISAKHGTNLLLLLQTLRQLYDLNLKTVKGYQESTGE
uniref:OBG-type G domain-containing protein n=1 Tax=Clastoptera arizonana TaxID=38151 RepID=A0A1B6C4I3_9HEMI